MTPEQQLILTAQVVLGLLAIGAALLIVFGILALVDTALGGHLEKALAKLGKRLADRIAGDE